MSLISLTDYRPMPRYDGKSWTGARIEGATAAEGPWSTIATVPFPEPEPDPAKPIERNFTVNVENPDTTWLRVVFIDEQGEQDAANPISTTAETVELAAIRDVAKRLGRFLTDGEEVQVNALIITATNNIYAAVGKSSTWVPSADVRDFLNGLCVELVVRAMPNPHALASQSESLGAHSVTQAYSRDIPGSGIALTDAEELAARRIVFGSNSGSARARSVVNDVAEDGYGDDIITTTPPTSGIVGPMGPAGPPGPQGEQGVQGAPGNTSLDSMWDYSAATTAPPSSGQIRTSPDPVVVGSPMMIYLSARDSQGLYWDLPDVTPNDNIRLRGTSGAVQYCDVTAFENTVTGPDGYVTIQTMVTSLTGQIAKNAKVDVTLFKAAVV